MTEKREMISDARILDALDELCHRLGPAAHLGVIERIRGLMRLIRERQQGDKAEAEGTAIASMFAQFRACIDQMRLLADERHESLADRIARLEIIDDAACGRSHDNPASGSDSRAAQVGYRDTIHDGCGPPTKSVSIPGLPVRDAATMGQILGVLEGFKGDDRGGTLADSLLSIFRGNRMGPTGSGFFRVAFRRNDNVAPGAVLPRPEPANNGSPWPIDPVVRAYMTGKGGPLDDGPRI